MSFKLYFILVQCVTFFDQNDLVGALIGQNVRQVLDNEFPFIASIMKVSTRRVPIQNLHRCTATLITKQDVLTAAHCLRDTLPSAIKVMMGSTNLSRCIERHPMYFITYNEWIHYSGRVSEFELNDIAFVKIIGNAPDSIELAPLGNAPHSVLYGNNVEISGWGNLLNNEFPTILRAATVLMLSDQQCEERFRAIDGTRIRVLKKQFCTVAEPYALLNYGDSGGPVLLFNSIIGINNGIVPDTEEDVYSEQINVHSSIRYYMPFIRAVMIPINY